MNINPELRRNLWLELSPQRLVGMPLLLGALFLVAFVSDDRQFGSAVAHSALFLFGLLPMVWGTKLAGEAVITEIRERTWDGQRMSVIRPWAMTWGKLLGSTVFPWYGALLCLPVYLLAAPVEAGPGPLRSVLLVAGAALLGQAVALLASLVSIRKNRRFSRSQAAAFFVLGFATGLAPLGFGLADNTSLVWFGTHFRGCDFTLLTLALLLTWALVGIHQLMRLELQMKNPLWVWPAFALFCMAYSAGFAFQPDGAAATGPASFALLPAYTAGVVLVYASAFAGAKDPMGLRRLLLAWRARDIRAMLRHAPAWSLILPLPLAVAMLLLLAPPPEIAGLDNHFRLALTAAQFFMLRDLALLVFFNLAQNRKRADMLTLLWLALLWLVIPLILSGLGLNGLAALFHPLEEDHALLSVIAAPCAMLLAVWLAARRWRAHYGRSGSTPSPAPKKYTSQAP